MLHGKFVLLISQYVTNKKDSLVILGEELSFPKQKLVPIWAITLEKVWNIFMKLSRLRQCDTNKKDNYILVYELPAFHKKILSRPYLLISMECIPETSQPSLSYHWDTVKQRKNLSHRRPAKAQAYAQSRQSLHCPHTWSMEVDKGSDLAPLDGCPCVFEEWVYRGWKMP